MRPRKFAPIMRCSSRSVGVSPWTSISSSRRRYPESACASLSTVWRLKSSRRSSCVWTPSSVAEVGWASYRYSRRSSTKCGRGSDAIIQIRQWYNNHDFSMAGTLFVVATPIGNLEDITARAIRILREASIIAAEDTRRTAHLLARYAITTPTTSLHEHNEAQKSASLVGRLERGDNVALVSDAGTPTISDPGHRLIKAAIDAGIRIEPIPGPSAVIAALAVSGLPSESFAFLGFPPVRSKARSAWFERARTIGGTIVFFESPHRIRETLAQLRVEIGDCQVVLCRELTKTHEELVRGPITSVLSELSSSLGEFTVVTYIGQTTEMARYEPPTPAEALVEFGELTNNGKLSRRSAVATLAK